MHDHDADIHAWAIEQAEWLRGRQFDRLDLEHLANQVECAARDERCKLVELVTELLAQLLLWQTGQQHSAVAVRIKMQRDAIYQLFSRCPSLRPAIGEPLWLDIVWGRARAQALSAGSVLDCVGECCCPWHGADVLKDGWLP